MSLKKFEIRNKKYYIDGVGTSHSTFFRKKKEYLKNTKKSRPVPKQKDKASQIAWLEVRKSITTSKFKSWAKFQALVQIIDQHFGC